MRQIRTLRAAATEYLNELDHASVSADAHPLRQADPFTGERLSYRSHMGMLQAFASFLHEPSVKQRRVK